MLSTNFPAALSNEVTSTEVVVSTGTTLFF